MKKLLIGIVSIVLAFTFSNVDAKAQNYNQEGKTFVQQGSSRGSSSSDIQTDYKWKDSKGVEYTIYLHQYVKGEKAGQWTCYVIKTSVKTGKTYKSYLKDGIEMAKTIRKEMGLQ